MNEISPEVAQAAVADPSTSAEQLGQIASQYRESWDAISTHPNVYPELVEWMEQQGFTPPTSQQVVPQQLAPQQSAPEQAAPEQAAPEQLAPQQSAPEQPGPMQQMPPQGAPMMMDTGSAPQYPAQPGMPQAQGVLQPGMNPAAQPAPRRRRALPWILGGAGAALLVVIAIVLVFVFVLMPGGGSTRDYLQAMGEPSDADQYTYSITNYELINELAESESGGFDWSETLDEADIDVAGSTELGERAAVEVSVYSEGVLTAYFGDYSARAVDDSGAESRGDNVWVVEPSDEDDDEQWLRLNGDALFEAYSEDELPSANAGEDGSVLDDTEFMAVFDALDSSTAVSIVASHFDEDQGLIEDLPETKYQGNSFSANGENSTIRLANGFASAEDAQEAESLLVDYVKDLLKDEVDGQLTVTSEVVGSVVVVSATAETASLATFYGYAADEAADDTGDEDDDM